MVIIFLQNTVISHLSWYVVFACLWIWLSMFHFENFRTNLDDFWWYKHDCVRGNLRISC